MLSVHQDLSELVIDFFGVDPNKVLIHGEEILFSLPDAKRNSAHFTITPLLEFSSNADLLHSEVAFVSIDFSYHNSTPYNFAHIKRRRLRYYLEELSNQILFGGLRSIGDKTFTKVSLWRTMSFSATDITTWLGREECELTTGIDRLFYEWQQLDGYMEYIANPANNVTHEQFELMCRMPHGYE